MRTNSPHDCGGPFPKSTAAASSADRGASPVPVRDHYYVDDEDLMRAEAEDWQHLLYGDDYERGRR